MNISDPDIVFDSKGICNHCKEYENKLNKLGLNDKDKSYQYIMNKFEEIKKEGKGKKYDCVIAFSGGADSSTVVRIAKETGLRAILVNADDGWGLPETAKNVEAIAKATGYPLIVYKLNEKEINDLYLSFLKANVIDIEMPIDQALQAVFIQTALKYKVKYILTGSNIQTEGIMAKAWAFNKQDLKNILDIHKKFGTVELKEYPKISLWKLYWYKLTHKIEYVKPLWYLTYNRANEVEILKQDYGWIPYGKNSESLFTRFDKRCILPMKFGVDKSRGNFSAMIMSGQMTRKEAIHHLEYDDYGHYDPSELWIKDMEDFCAKLGVTQDWFFEYIFEKPVPHTNFATYAWLYKLISLVKWIKRGGKNK